jgi:hypothetical protein
MFRQLADSPSSRRPAAEVPPIITGEAFPAVMELVEPWKDMRGSVVRILESGCAAMDGV